MEICLDTNAYSAFKRNITEVVRFMETAESIIIPSVVLGELFAGFFRGSQAQKNMVELDRFLALPGVEVRAVDASTAERYGSLVKALFDAGTPIPTNDIWIAAISIESSSRLLSADRHFEKVPGLVQLWFQE